MTRALTHDEITELLGAYALDAVDPEEAAAIGSHLSTCPQCRAEVAEYHRVAGLLANSGGDAPAHLWPRIAAQANAAAIPDDAAPRELAVPIRATTGTGPASAPLTPEGPEVPVGRRRRRAAWAMPALAAVAAIVIAVLGVQVAHLNHQVGRLQASSQRQELIRAAQAAQADPLATHVPLAAAHTTGPALAEIVSLPSGAAFMVDSRLPTLPPSKTYQLWGDVSGHLVSLGLLGSHPTDVAFRLSPAAHVSLFAVTAERAGGVVQSANIPVAEGQTSEA